MQNLTSKSQFNDFIFQKWRLVKWRTDVTSPWLIKKTLKQISK